MGGGVGGWAAHGDVVIWEGAACVAAENRVAASWIDAGPGSMQEGTH